MPSCCSCLSQSIKPFSLGYINFYKNICHLGETVENNLTALLLNVLYMFANFREIYEFFLLSIQFEQHI